MAQIYNLGHDGRQASYALQKAREIEENAASLNGPSKFKYGIVGMMASFVDVAVPVLSLDPTGIGGIIGGIIAVSISGFTIPFVLWITDSNHKRNVRFIEELGGKVEDAQKMMPGSRRSRSALMQRAGEMGKAVKANPVLKTLFGGLLDSIPIVGIFNLLTVWVYLTYRDEAKTYKSAQEESEKAIIGLMSQINQLPAGKEDGADFRRKEPAKGTLNAVQDLQKAA